MMITVNLLPGAAAGGRGTRRRFALPAWGERLRSIVTDRYLAVAVVGVLASASVVGVLHAGQQQEGAALTAREEVAVADSARYATLIKARRLATAERDSVSRQIAIIAAIDSNRYVWAHVLDEMSRALPPYTWLTSVQQTSAPPAPPTTAAERAAVAAAKDGAKGASDAAPAADSGGASPRGVTFRVVGQTVDIQALTQFLRDLEGSPFLGRVQLARSEIVLVDGREVTEFTLDGSYQTPPRTVVRTETIVVPVAAPTR
jgi:Tfp pilus assembly protein PilN